MELFSTESRIKSPSVVEQPTILQEAQPLALQFDHVSFHYEDQCQGTPENDDAQSRIEHVLWDVDFSLAPGEVLGLLGRTGSGKTTLTRLLFRLYDPQTGTVNLSTHAYKGEILDIRKIPLQNLRDQIGMVTQNIELFHASVRDNLTFFDTTIPDQKIIDTIHALGLSRWFAGLRKGLDTVLESGGAGLSAGEAQLLAFVRIFLKDPAIVVLDEASSRLDPATEHLIERAIDTLVTGRTALVIAHRLKTVQRADKIMILEEGRLIEFGDRLALAMDPHSRFSQLLQAGIEEVLA